MNCPSCQSPPVKKNGHLHNGKQNFRCKECGRQFVADTQKKTISDHDQQMIKNLLSERLSLRGMCRALQVSLTWLLHFFREVTDETPDEVGVTPPATGKRTLELDELWRFVGTKENKQWLWLAFDRHAENVVGWDLGGRGEEEAKQVWASLPGGYQQCAVCYPDFGDASAQVAPSCRHRPVGKETGETSHIERTNGTFRQRISRLVRKTFSFSKSNEKHRRAITYFIWCFNVAT